MATVNDREHAQPIRDSDVIAMKQAAPALRVEWNQFGGAPVTAVARDTRAGNVLTRGIWAPLDAETMRAMSDEMWRELKALAKKQAAERKAYDLNSK